MVVWTIEKTGTTIQLDKSGWFVCRKGKAYRFNSLRECLAYLAGCREIKHDHIDLLMRSTWERYE